MLDAHNLQHRYGKRTVLSIAEISLAEGQITALVGPNGCGKSSLLRLLAFVEQPAGGEITLAGRNIRSAADRRWARARVTLVEQRPFLFRGTVRENLRYGLALHGITRTDVSSRIEETLERLNASQLAGRDARSLSEGEVQLVAVVRALSLRPDVLLLDEPASAADRGTAQQLYAMLEADRSAGMTICLASHQLEDAYRWSDKIVAMSGGRIGSVTPENLFRVVVSEAGFTAVKIGRLDLHLVADQSGPALVAIPPEDIVVSTERLTSSARNQFTGKVMRISDDGRGHVTVAVDVGVDLVARVTPGAVAELDIKVGCQVFLSVKATAVRLY